MRVKHPAEVHITNPSRAVMLNDTVITASNPLPVTGTVATGGLTDTELRATPVPVSGTFFQTTQPVSVASLPLPSSAATDTVLQQVRDRAPVALSSADAELTHVPFTVTASGDTDLRTPAVGKAIRLHWISLLNDPSATSPALMKVFLGTDEKYRGYAISKRQRVTGPVDGHLIINLSASGNVSGTAILEEV